MKDEDRGEDFVTFRLKKDAPEYVAIGKARFSGQFRRADEPFRATRSEWKAFLEPMGYFEEIEGRESKVESGKGAESSTLNS